MALQPFCVLWELEVWDWRSYSHSIVDGGFELMS